MDIGWYASKPKFPAIAFQIYRNSFWDPRRKKPQFAEYDPFMDDIWYIFLPIQDGDFNSYVKSSC